MSAKHLILEYTLGIRNALHRYSPRLVCPSCDFAVPKYPGRYPKACPECKEPLTSYEARKKKVRESTARSPWDSLYGRKQDYIETDDEIDLIHFAKEFGSTRYEEVPDGWKFTFDDDEQLGNFEEALDQIGISYTPVYGTSVVVGV